MDIGTLCERLQSGMGPDRELDAHLHCLREELEFVLLATGREAYGDICDRWDSGYGSPNKCSTGWLYARYPDHKNPPTLGGGRRGNSVQGCKPPNYTSSLDAAVTLIKPIALQALVLRKAIDACQYREGEWLKALPRYICWSAVRVRRDHPEIDAHEALPTVPA